MRRAGPPRSPHLGICHVFYETRVLLGRDMTLQRFAREVLGGEVEAVMLGYIEKGERLPSESLVRRLALVREEEPRNLLALLSRDRMLRALGKELRKFLALPTDVPDIEDAELALQVSRAITALPDDSSWVPVEQWRTAIEEAAPRKGGRRRKLDADRIERIEAALAEQNLTEVAGDRVRRRGHHYEPAQKEERLALASEYAVLFFKGLVDRLAFPDEERGTYLRNHYLHISPEKMSEFQADLDEALRGLARKYGEPQSKETEFLNILATAVHL